MENNQEPAQTPHILNGETSETAQQSASLDVPSRKPLSAVAIGVFFLAISVFGAVSLMYAYYPRVVSEINNTQTASAAAAPKPNHFKDLTFEAKSVYVYDAASQKELFSKNPSMQLPLASITKVALVLAIADALPMDSIVTISRDAVEKGEGGLTWGEEWLAKDLIDYTLITSSNTGAEALAEAANPLLAARFPEGSQSNATIWRMNALAQSLGMHETYFINPTGLDESTTQSGAQSSASDIASLFAYALKTHPDVFLGTTKTEIPLGPLNYPERYAHNTNNALTDIEGLIMGKTGTTDLAGGNLAIAFNAAPNHPVVIVVLGSSPEGRYTDIKKLIDAARKTVLEAQ